MVSALSNIRSTKGLVMRLIGLVVSVMVGFLH